MNKRMLISHDFKLDLVDLSEYQRGVLVFGMVGWSNGNMVGDPYPHP